MVFVLFSISVLVVPHLLRDAGRRPGGADRRAERRPADAARRCGKDFGLDKPLPVQYALMMKKLFITRDLTSYVNRGAKVIPQVTQAAPVTLSLVLRRRGHLGDRSHRDGPARRRLPGHADRHGRDDRRPDRHLDAGLLARRGREPAHAEPPARHVPLLVGAAARLHAVHAVAVRLVQVAAAAVADAVDPLHRASTRACCARRSSRRRRRTTCAPRARRGSPSGACSSGTRCARR